MGIDEKTNAAAEVNETGEAQSKKAAKKLAKEAAKAAKVIRHVDHFKIFANSSLTRETIALNLHSMDS